VVGFVTSGGESITIGGRVVQSLRSDEWTRLEMAPANSGVLVTLAPKNATAKRYFVPREKIVIELAP
jgi:hypothetical protein